MLTPIDQALEYFLTDAESRHRLLDSVRSSITAASGHFLSENILSTINVPPHDNSAMDGIVLDQKLWQSFNRSEKGNKKLAENIIISDRIIAGDTPSALKLGTCARIFTGAPIPKHGSCVVMQEECVFNPDNSVSLKDEAFPLTAKQNIRAMGQDIKQGEILFQAGHQIRPQDIGLMASIGIAEVEIRRPLKVAVINTGNELQMPGEPAKPGKIFNSNGFLLQSLLENMSCEVHQTAIIADQQSLIESQLNALTGYDCIITTGGVSVGEEDHMRAAIENVGKLAHWKLAIKPGKPLAFGHIHDTPIWGLPGNPVSAFVTFLAVVKPYLRTLLGAKAPLPLHTVSSSFTKTKPSTRQEFLRVSVDCNQQATPHANQSSGVLTSVTRCDGLAIIPANSTVKMGQKLQFMDFKDWT